MQPDMRCRVRAAVLLVVAASPAAADDNALFPLVKPEQQRLMYHDPAALPGPAFTLTEPPPTLRSEEDIRGSRPIALDEAIAIALRHSEVVRVLGGAIASTSGRTIYDAALANQAVDQQRAAFDPVATINNDWRQFEPPPGAVDFIDPDGPDPELPFASDLRGSKTENYAFSAGVSQRNLAGGTARYQFSNDNTRISPGTFGLNPQNQFFNEIGYVQPLLAGAGIAANRVPIVLARIDAERSFFQLSAAVQELIRGTVDAYWNVVFARTDVFARETQVAQAEEAFNRAQARKEVGIADVTEVAQTRSALASFRASLLVAKGNLLNAEAALLNILGLPPTVDYRLVPTTPPLEGRVAFDWPRVLALAGERRPDLIELKLVLDADAQQLLRSRNLAAPRLDASGTYRWNGIVGETPDGNTRSSNGGQFTDWTLGVNFSVPLGLRAERAAVRQTELLIARDRANLQQGYHNAAHILALTIRNIEQAYLQYEAFKQVREAAVLNFKAQEAAYRNEREVQLVNVLNAISDYGNAISQEANALLAYNTALASLERETGTILETHGVFLAEDLRCAVGPCVHGVFGDAARAYSHAHRPSSNAARYPGGDRPAEETFDLDELPETRRRSGETDTDRPSNLEELLPLPLPDERLPGESLPDESPPDESLRDEDEGRGTPLPLDLDADPLDDRLTGGWRSRD